MEAEKMSLQTQKVSDKEKNSKKRNAKLIVRFNLKRVLPKGMRLGKEVADALDKIVKEKLRRATYRAKENKRTTVLSQDL